MKAILYILSAIILCFNVPNFLTAQEVDNPPQILVDNAWYLTKLIIDDEEYSFVPSQGLQNVNLNLHVDSSNEEEVSGLLTTEFYEAASASFDLQGDEDLYTWDWGFMANESNCCSAFNNENIANDYLYFDIFWMDSGQNEPYHHTYLINQNGSMKELIITTDNGNQAYFQNIELSLHNNKKDQLTLYPNPAEDYLYIENLTESVEINIYNLSGKMLLSQELNEAAKQVNLSQLSEGIYLYQLSQNGRKVKMGKLVKN